MDTATLVWIDLELTGLNPKIDQIVEIAVIVSDLQCSQITPGPDLIIHASEEKLLQMSEYVQTMHRNSGLTEKIRASELTVEQAETQVMDFLSSQGVTGGVLAGNSIHQDRKFLRKGMPRLCEEFLDPVRIFNVSSIKEVGSAWYRSLQPPGKRLKHRSLEDILESIEEYRYYQQTILKRF